MMQNKVRTVVIAGKFGCEIIYGIGDLLNSSSKIAREVKCESF